MGYMLGGLDWTGTALGRVFKSQEQIDPFLVCKHNLYNISYTAHAQYSRATPHATAA